MSNVQSSSLLKLCQRWVETKSAAFIKDSVFYEQNKDRLLIFPLEKWTQQNRRRKKQ